MEEKFYLLWPLLLLALLKKRPSLIRSIVLIILGQWIYRAVLYLVFHVGEGWVYHTFDMRADALLVGCLLAILVENECTRLPLCSVLRWQWLSIVPPLILGFLTIKWANNRALYVISRSIQPLIIAVMLLQFVYWGSKSWTVCRSATVRFIAQISYALYLYHPLAGEIIYVFRIPHLGYSTMFLTLLMSASSYYFVERPFMRMRDRRTQAPVMV